MTDDSAFKLCYIEGSHLAYFTTCPLDKQRGDDWDSVSYESNARHPYPFDARRNTEPYELKTLSFVGPFNEPCFGYLNSPFSVEMINAGAVPWLMAYPFVCEPIAIPAGTTIPDFIRLMQSAGGIVYYPLAVGENTLNVSR